MVTSDVKFCCHECKYAEGYSGVSKFNCSYYDEEMDGEAVDCVSFEKSKEIGRPSQCEDCANLDCDGFDLTCKFADAVIYLGQFKCKGYKKA